jgi:hypothetical protein
MKKHINETMLRAGLARKPTTVRCHLAACRLDGSEPRGFAQLALVLTGAGMRLQSCEICRSQVETALVPIARQPPERNPRESVPCSFKPVGVSRREVGKRLRSTRLYGLSGGSNRTHPSELANCANAIACIDLTENSRCSFRRRSRSGRRSSPQHSCRDSFHIKLPGCAAHVRTGSVNEECGWSARGCP